MTPTPFFRRPMMLVIGATLLGFAAPLRAQAPVKWTMEDVLKKLMQSSPHRVVGWERVGVKDHFILASEALITAFAKADLALIAKAVKEQTDYQCLVESDCVVVFPKANPPATDCLVTRKASFPSATDVMSDEYLASIAPLNKEKVPVGLGGSAVLSLNDALGEISMKNEVASVYIGLNKMARQLKAQCWIVTDMLGSDPLTGKPVMPKQLSYGSVVFYRTPVNVPYVRLGK